MSDPTSVLFVCVSNRGKSVMAEKLAPTITTAIAASSAGTDAKLGAAVNPLSAQVLAERGASADGHEPRQLTDELMRAADLVVVVGTAEVTAPDGVRVEVWDTDEPLLRGIDGLERMRLVGDDIGARIRALADRLGQ
ncbi:low molecular weight phosphatase family protein [Actinomycetes bacterium M1A6_2h]